MGVDDPQANIRCCQFAAGRGEIMIGRLSILKRPQTHAARWIPRASLAVGAMAIFAACGSVSGAPPSASPSLNPQAAALAFTQCMRAHGVSVADPIVSSSGSAGGQVHTQIGTGGPDKGSSQMQAAMTACQKYLHQIGGNGPGTPDPARQAQELQFAQCMRSHGLADFPDP